MEIDSPIIRGKNFLIKCSCDGMLCLAIIADHTLVLWNPSIRVNKRLPLLPSKPSHVRGQVFGFGYDSSIKDYKVVSFDSNYCSHCFESYPSLVYVLTLTTNSWRKIGDVNPYYVHPFELAIPVNGGLYWRAGLDLGTQNLILRFDLAEETFREAATPPIEGLGKDAFGLGQLKGSLCMYRNCVLWVMKEEGELWSKMMIFKPPRNNLQPLCLTKSGKAVFAELEENKLVICDPKAEAPNKLDIRWLGKSCCQKIGYSESLISPESGSGMKDID